jgi:hypothetical protein
MTEKKPVTEEAMFAVLDGMFNSIKKEEADTHGDAVDALIASHKYLDIHKPEHFSLLISNTLSAQEELLFDKAIAPEDLPTLPKVLHRFKFAYTHYNFIDRHLKKTIYAKEGHACSTDKTRYLIDSYVQYIATGKLPTRAAEKHYWEPSAGTYQQWVDFIGGMYDLYYGDLKPYVLAQLAILQAYDAIPNE